MSSARVSVVIPNFNHAKYLDARIQSVLNQDFKNFEVILLDDASVDNSLDVIRRYQDRVDFKVVVNKKNSGSTFEQWRRGISLSCGEYIWIAESDDLADPRFLSSLVAKLDANPEVVLAYCQSNYIDEWGEISGSAKAWTDDLDSKRWGLDFINSGIDECKYFLSVKNTIPNASGVVFRKACFYQIDTATNMRLCGDWLIWARLVRLGKIAFCKDSLNYFRIHANNVRSNITRDITAREFLRATREIIDSCKLEAHERKLVAKNLVIFWKSFLLSHKYTISLKFCCYLATLDLCRALNLFSVITNRRLSYYFMRFRAILRG